MVNQNERKNAMTQETNKPAFTERFGGLKGTIWRNPGTDGKPDRYTVSYSRSYKTADGQWKETTSFSAIDNLKLGHLVGKVTDRIAELKAIDASGQTPTSEDE
ncbi:hypothetical protein RESH_05397 [Rhodopirellula europaea SH398]|uniref:Uncharacterized protein n=2 Tax=Rhodopirellula TaxID=265488 RepID=M5RXP7_9BACT|nr:hypothetical protein RESH_05397 [Rhodopirellula europaea SH398]